MATRPVLKMCVEFFKIIQRCWQTNARLIGEVCRNIIPLPKANMGVRDSLDWCMLSTIWKPQWWSIHVMTPPFAEKSQFREPWSTMSLIQDKNHSTNGKTLFFGLVGRWKLLIQSTQVDSHHIWLLTGLNSPSTMVLFMIIEKDNVFVDTRIRSLYMEHYNTVAPWINVQTLAVIELILSAPIDTTQIAVAVSCFIHSM